MLRRRSAPLLRRLLRAYPASTLVGPRQCGKTTLAKSIGGAYFDLELESERIRLDLEWPALVRSTRPVILDEAQTHPAIFPRIRAAIDATAATGLPLLGTVGGRRRLFARRPATPQLSAY